MVMQRADLLLLLADLLLLDLGLVLSGLETLAQDRCGRLVRCEVQLHCFDRLGFDCLDVQVLELFA